MHRWRKLDRTTVVLCSRCSQKEYKTLEIREVWKKNEVNQEFTCELCGVKKKLSLAAFD